MRVRIHPAFAAYLASVCALTSPWACAGLVISLTAHELGHLAAARLLHEPVERVELAPFGGVMTCKPGHSLSKGLRGVLLAAAGPLANYVAILAAGSPWAVRIIPAELLRQTVRSSWAMMLLNMLPALPLDGGSVVFSIAYYGFGVARLAALLSGLGVLLGAALLALAVFGALRMGVLNLSLVIVGAYLTLCALRSRDALLTQNLYAVVEERLRKPEACRRMTAYCVPGDTPVVRLLPAMAGSRGVLFFVETDGHTPQLLDERTVCRAMLQSPRLTAAQTLKNLASNR